MVSAEDVHWMAGLMEGEGFFGLRRKADLTCAVCMTDKDVVDRLHRIVGFGSRRQRTLPSGKIAYTWTSTNQRETAGFMMTLLGLMGERRGAKIRYCLEMWKSKPLPREMWTHCKRGHPLSGDNLKINWDGKYERRRCRKCATIRSSEGQKRKRACNNLTLALET